MITFDSLTIKKNEEVGFGCERAVIADSLIVKTFHTTVRVLEVGFDFNGKRTVLGFTKL